MKKIFMSNASAMLGVPVEAWASPVKFLFPERPKEELARFIEDINEQNAEFMSYKKEFEVGVDLSPSYQQLSQDRIDDQCSKNILMLKSFEHVLEERLVAFNKFLDSLSKTRTSFDAFQSSEGSLRQALDALFVFIEQELQQARQQLSLGDLKKALTETKAEAVRKAGEYQKEVAVAESDVVTAEKTLQKTKDGLKKLLVQKKRMEMGSHSSDSVGGLYFRSSGSLKSPPPSPSPSSSLDSFPGVTHSHPNFHAPAPSSADLDKNERYQEHKEQLDRTLAEVRQQIRDLLRLIGVRDQVLAASRRAHQLLNKQCKGAISSILRKLVDREREALAARTIVVDKLDKAVESLSNEEDELEFIESYREDGRGELVQCSQALSILGDIVTIDKISKLESELEASDERASLSSASGNSAPSNPFARRVSSGTVPSLCSMEETTMLLSRIFFMTEWPSRIVAPAASVEDVLAAFLEEPPADPSEDSALRTCIQRLVQLSENLEGRKVLVNVLNQFRSKQVDVGVGFKLLAAVLWSLLTKCKSANDVHNGKIVMMLSQTFYMLVFEDSPSSLSSNSALSGEEEAAGKRDCGEEEEEHAAHTGLQEGAADDDSGRPSSEGEEKSGREDGGARRRYLKQLLISHSIWLDGRFWEQALWQCVLDQLGMIQIEEKWHDMDHTERLEAVRRVHDVIFSQVMAIAHSMIELGCSKASAREFVYRMCVVHQLSERQQHELVKHLNAHNNSDQ